MRDPKPENITGSKQHRIEWQVDVGQVLLGLALIYVAWKVAPLFAEGNDEEESARPGGR